MHRAPTHFATKSQQLSSFFRKELLLNGMDSPISSCQVGLASHTWSCYGVEESQEWELRDTIHYENLDSFLTTCTVIMCYLRRKEVRTTVRPGSSSMTDLHHPSQCSTIEEEVRVTAVTIASTEPTATFKVALGFTSEFVPAYTG